MCGEHRMSILPTQGAVETVCPNSGRKRQPQDKTVPTAERKRPKTERVDTPSGAEPAACRTASSWREVAHKLRKNLFLRSPLSRKLPLYSPGTLVERTQLLCVRRPNGRGSSQGPKADDDAVDPRFQAALLNPCLHSERPAEGMGYDTDTDVVKDKMLAFF